MPNGHDDLVCVYTPKRRALRPLLTAWTDVVLRYCAIEHHQDNPWWFNERATLSTLAGAAWSLPGWAALEEFSTRKRGGIVPKDRTDDGSRTGRCDLYVTTRRRDNSYAIEAKQAWQPIGPRSDGCQNVLRMMKSAWDDAGNLHIEDAAHRLAITFIVPFITKSHTPETHREMVEQWLVTIESEVERSKLTAYAHVFPKNFQHFKNEVSELTFPGVVMLVKERFKANRRQRE